MLDPKDFIITRKRKKYKFALFANSSICYEMDEWKHNPTDSLEVGAGTGLFSVAMAEMNPDYNFTAVDVKADRLIQGARESDKKNLKNVTFLRARADQLLSLFKNNSLKSIWVTFPDPFPKKRSSGRRLTHPVFLDIYAKLLRPDGAFYFKTDSRDLFEWSLEQLVAEGWHIEELSFDLHESKLADYYKIETTYESRFRAEGMPIYFVKATRPH